MQGDQLIPGSCLRLNQSQLQGASNRRADVNFPDWRRVIAAPAEDFSVVIRERSQRTVV